MRELLIGRANSYRVNALDARILYSKTVFIELMDICDILLPNYTRFRSATLNTHAHTSARVRMRVSNWTLRQLIHLRNNLTRNIVGYQ